MNRASYSCHIHGRKREVVYGREYGPVFTEHEYLGKCPRPLRDTTTAGFGTGDPFLPEWPGTESPVPGLPLDQGQGTNFPAGRHPGRAVPAGGKVPTMFDVLERIDWQEVVRASCRPDPPPPPPPSSHPHGRGRTRPREWPGAAVPPREQGRVASPGPSPASPSPLPHGLPGPPLRPVVRRRSGAPARRPRGRRAPARAAAG